ncbi:helix-turn-helix transcriptional regulator [Aquimarina addita]
MNLYNLSDTDIFLELAHRVKKRRLNLNITQEELSNKAGLHVQTIKNFEAGKTTNLLTFIQILRAFGDLDALDSFLPDPGVSPIQLLKLKGKERERASGNSKDNTNESSW